MTIEAVAISQKKFTGNIFKVYTKNESVGLSSTSTQKDVKAIGKIFL
jgi:glycerol-3-phosphate dehydrogenase